MTRSLTRSKLLLVAGALVVLAAVLGGLSYAGDEQPRPVPPPSDQDVSSLRAAALDIAARNGESSPSRIRIVAGPRLAVIERLMYGAEVDTDQDVYVVAMEGEFVAENARRPPGAPAPRGTHLVLVFDAVSKKLTDLSVSNAAPPIEHFGTPIDAG